MTLPRRIAPWLAAVAVIYFLYFFHLDAAGLLGPDEPRYASIARQMARSGDWVTPVLWGKPWFEKPALLYWMSALGFTAGLSPELAPRLPVALAAVAFLGFFFWRIRAEFGVRTAAYAAVVLGTSAGWLAFSHVAVTDLPLAAAFSAAVLLAIPWVIRGERRFLPWAAAWLGLAVLAKGLVPLVLVLPVLWFGRGRWKDLVAPRVWLAFLAVAVPWYALCYLRNGWPFIQEFLIEHHLGRFADDALLHRQPFWFFLPILPAALLPWTPLLALLFRRKLYADTRLRLLATVCVFGLLFFSASTNKLPAYVLPLIPSLAALAGAALNATPRAPALLAGCAALLTAWPLAADILPAAVARGLSRAAPPVFNWTWLLPALAACLVFVLERAGRRVAAVAAVAIGCAIGVVSLKIQAFPVLDSDVSARGLWRRLTPCRDRICIENLHRAVRYGLNYYAVDPIPDCQTPDSRLRLRGQWISPLTICPHGLTRLPPTL